MIRFICIFFPIFHSFSSMLPIVNININHHSAFIPIHSDFLWEKIPNRRLNQTKPTEIVEVVHRPLKWNWIILFISRKFQIPFTLLCNAMQRNTTIRCTGRGFSFILHILANWYSSQSKLNHICSVALKLSNGKWNEIQEGKNIIYRFNMSTDVKQTLLLVGSNQRLCSLCMFYWCFCFWPVCW